MKSATLKIIRRTKERIALTSASISNLDGVPRQSETVGFTLMKPLQARGATPTDTMVNWYQKLKSTGHLMKIGVSAFAWTKNFNESHINLIPMLREQGLDGFEIPMFHPADLPARQLRRAFEASDMECTVCAIPPTGINPISPDLSVRTRSVAHLIQCVETAAEAGAHLICGPVYAPIGYLPGRRRTQEELDWAVDALHAMGDVLEVNQMILAIEPVNRSETFLINTAREAAELCERIGNPRVGITIDTFHANIEEKSISGAMDDLGKRLRHVHVSENDRGLVGSGHVDFPDIVKTLHDIGYDGFLMIEGFGYSPDEPGSLGALWGDLAVSPEDIAFKGASYLRNLVA